LPSVTLGQECELCTLYRADLTHVSFNEPHIDFNALQRGLNAFISLSLRPIEKYTRAFSRVIVAKVAGAHNSFLPHANLVPAQLAMMCWDRSLERDPIEI
jgi:hypothetical protein